MNYWDFEKEIKDMAASCVEVKPATARRKARILFDKYSSIISHDQAEKDYQRERAIKYESLFNIYRSGRITYNGGFLMLSEIESIETDKDNINIKSKSGYTISFNKNDWGHLMEL